MPENASFCPFCGKQFGEAELRLAREKDRGKKNKAEIAKEYFTGRFSVLLLFIVAAFLVVSKYHRELLGLFTLIIVLPVIFLGYLLIMKHTLKKFSVLSVDIF